MFTVCLSVPPLEGFVMNRVQGDYFETLLYKIFVSIDEQTNVAEVGFKNVFACSPLLCSLDVIWLSNAGLLINFPTPDFHFFSSLIPSLTVALSLQMCWRLTWT